MKENELISMSCRTLRRILCIVTAIMVVCSCGKSHKTMLPKGGGKPYDVLLVSDNYEAREMVRGLLDMDMAGLPQSEPMFDVSATDNRHYADAGKLARCIVMVDIDGEKFTSTHIRYEKDAYAHPQIIVHVNTPSEEQLRKDRDKIAPRLHQLITRAEMNMEIESLQKTHNPKAERMITNMFGCMMLIPASMKSSKRGRNFLWFSNDAPEGMQNICVYSYEGGNADKEAMTRMRDSIMKENIPGELPNMYMHTVAESVNTHVTKEKNGTVVVSRGLWEMVNDAMGGPFVSHGIIDSTHNRVVVAEAFVYAPEMKKRNKIRQIEAALHTLKVKK